MPHPLHDVNTVEASMTAVRSEAGFELLVRGVRVGVAHNDTHTGGDARVIISRQQRTPRWARPAKSEGTQAAAA